MNLEPTAINRRDWVVGLLALGSLGAGTADADSAIEAIKGRGRKAAMAGFDESETTHYRAIGDARKSFREEALRICEVVAADYFKVFTDKGFAPTWPDKKLTVVTLAGPKSYAMFEGGFLDQAIGGHFDLDANWLVMFDFRGEGANPKAAIPEQDNTLVLVHETIHQLTFNTGLLDLKADTPLAIIGGLATFGETWSPRSRSGLGAINLRRRKGLEGGKWIPLAALLADDKLLDDEKTRQVAYAESWLLVHKLLKDPGKLPGFRDYLAELRKRPDPSRRIEIATLHLGNLEKLDKEIRTGRQ